jgi:beta-lactamase class A
MNALVSQIDSIASSAGATEWAVAYHDYGTDSAWSCRGGRWFHAASTIKVAVLFGLLAAVEEGRFTLADRLHVRNRFISAEDGAAYALDPSRDANDEVQAAVGKLLRLHELAEHMIQTSSNLASNLLLDLVGVEAARRALARQGLADGLDLVRGVEDDAAHRAGVDNRVTADGLVAVFRRIEERRAVSEAASERMLEILRRQEFKSGIPAGVPDRVRPQAAFAHKTGDTSTVSHDAGIVHLPERPPYVVAILTEWEDGASPPRRETIARISRAVYGQVTEPAP